MRYIHFLKQFFLKNNTPKQTVVKNTFWLLIAEFINKWSVFFMMFLLAKYLWPEQYWLLSYIISFTALFSIIVDYSLANVTIKESAKNSEKTNSYFIHGVYLKLLLGIVNIIIVRWISYFLVHDSVLFSLLMIYCFYTIINNIWEYLRIRFRPIEKMEHEALLKTINWILFLMIVWFLTISWWTIQEIIYWFIFAGLINLCISIIYIFSVSNFQPNAFHFQKDIFSVLLKQWFYLALGVFFINITINFDQFLLWYLWFNFDLWIYSLWYKMTFIYTVLFAMFFQTLLPRIAKEPNKTIFTQWLRRVTSINIILITLYWWVAYSLYHQSYRDIGAYKWSLVVFLFLLTYCVFESYGHWSYLHLLALWKEKIIVSIFCICAVFNIILNLLLIPHYSYRWAIVATIMTYALYCFSSYAMALYWYKTLTINSVNKSS